MTAFTYHRPQTLAEAFDLLGEEGAVALAGGTDLIVGIRNRKTVPTMVVDLKQVSEVGDEIVVDGERVTIGGRVTMRQIVDSEVVNRHFGALAAAAAVVGSVQIRNRATLAGNICNASPAADTVPALLAFDARVDLAGRAGHRSLDLVEFFLGPGSTVLARGEVVTSLSIPAPTGVTGSAFARVTRRKGVDLATVSVACAVTKSGRARFGFGAVGPTPLAAASTIDDLETEEGWSRLLAVATPISDVRAGSDYRSAMLRVHSKRAYGAAVSGMGRS